MDMLVFVVALVVLAVLASRIGHDSRPHVQSQEERLASAGFLIDHETTTVLPDTVTAVAASARKAAARAFGLRTG